MDNQKQGPYIQQIVCGGKEIKPSFLQQSTLIESMDLSGPKLILKFNDPDSVLYDDIGVKPTKTLTVTFTDFWHDDEAGNDPLVDNFFIQNMLVESEIVTLKCLQSDIKALKSPAYRPMMLVQRHVPVIARRLMPNVRYEIDRFTVDNNYLVSPGECKSNVLRNLGWDLGAKVFYRRGTLVIRKREDMFDDPPAFTYAYNSPQAPFQIIHYQSPHGKEIVYDSTEKRNCERDMIESSDSAANHSQNAAESVRVVSLAALHNISITFPEVEFTVPGSGALAPGMALALEWNLKHLDPSLDESLPKKIIISTLTHNYQEQKYLTCVNGILPPASL